MQGNDANILELSDKIKAFVRKIPLWRFDVPNNSGHEYFPFLNRMLTNLPLLFYHQWSETNLLNI